MTPNQKAMTILRHALIDNSIRFIMVMFVVVAVTAPGMMMKNGSVLVMSQEEQRHEVSIYNAIKDPTIGNRQAIVGFAGPTTITDNTTEFPAFVSTYDVDITSTKRRIVTGNSIIVYGTITMTLVGNERIDALDDDLVLPTDTFDRYYISMPDEIGSVKIKMDFDTIYATASVLEPGYALRYDDPFDVRLAPPVFFDQGGILIEIGEGSNMTTLGQVLTVRYFLPRPKAVSLFNTFEDPNITSGIEVAFGFDGPKVMTRDIEFPQYINFFDVNVGLTRIVMTLINNTIATDLVMPEGRFDRYYFSFHKTIANAKVVKKKFNDISASTTILEPGSFVEFNDPFETGLGSPMLLPKGGLLVTIGPGSNLTNLGQVLTINYELGKRRNVTCKTDSLVLWDANEDTIIGPLEDIVDLCELGVSNLTIEAVAPCADKVKFTLLDDDRNVIIKRKEKIPPFVLSGDLDSDLTPVEALGVVGNYTLKAKTIPGSRTKKKNFQVVSGCV